MFVDLFRDPRELGFEEGAGTGGPGVEPFVHSQIAACVARVVQPFDVVPEADVNTQEDQLLHGDITTVILRLTRIIGDLDGDGSVIVLPTV